MAPGWTVPLWKRHGELRKRTTALWQTVLGPGELCLLRLEEIPADLREVAIMTGYRPPRCSLRQCLLSAFAATNETLNIWTHFLPALYFSWRLAESWRALDVTSDPYGRAYAAYMTTACLYPLTSALAHTFYALSDLARDVWFFLDYGALSLYSFGAGLLYRAYVFPEELLGGAFADAFLWVCAANAALCTLLACSSRFAGGPAAVKAMRLGAFALPWLWDSAPLVYRLALEARGGSPAGPEADHYLRHFVFSLLIGFFYASHLPERLAPGRFDIVGHSHQMLHVCGVLATNEQMNGALRDLRRRRPRAPLLPSSDFWCLDAAPCVLLVNLAIVALFALASGRRAAGRRPGTKTG